MTDKQSGFIPSTVLESRLTEKYRLDDNREPYVVVLSGPDRGKQFKLDRQVNSFGRSTEAIIVLTDPKVSRLHGAFILFPREIVLEDYQSANGTYINGQRITKSKVDLLSRIQIGNTELKIDYKKHQEVQSDDALYRAAHIDPLTQILNRGAFMARAQEQLERCKQFETSLAVVLCDVDHFKQKNDNYGHLAGDKILIELAGLLTKQMRSGDLLGRYGGEEFILMFPETSSTEALACSERFRHAVSEHRFEFQGQTIPVTLSAGICCCTGEFAELTAMIQAADNALYKAKKTGRNRVVLA